MSSTNSTNNYNLSQYVNNDKPTYLGDYNADMAKIDTALHTNATNIQTATQTANQATQTANTANTTAETAQNTANTANTTANSALTKATANETAINHFNLTNFKTLNLTADNATITNIQDSPLTIAMDASKSIFKLYGSFAVGVSNPSTDTISVVSEDTGLRPSQDYFINPCGIREFTRYTPTQGNINTLRCKIRTDGKIEFIVPFDTSIVSQRCICFPCLYFNKNFGDV